MHIAANKPLCKDLPMLHDFFFPITLLLILTFTLTKARASEVVHVFILAGQSNMVGAGEVETNLFRNGGKGSLQWLTENSSTKDSYSHLRNNTGAWVKRDDVLIWFLDRKGPLEPGYGSNPNKIGPELGFGWTIGDAFEEPVLLIKIAWGGKSLAKDFRPPSLEGETGPYYTKIIEHTKDVLKRTDKLFPQVEGAIFMLSGFGWHQGWNDGLSHDMVAAYEENLVCLIKDIRRAWKAPDLPVVIAVSGFGGRNQKIDRRLGIIAAQHGAADRKEFKGTAASVETRDFFRPREQSPGGQGYHWNNNAETYYLIGESMGNTMLKLLK